jgi:DNA topoisomerase-1
MRRIADSPVHDSTLPQATGRRAMQRGRPRGGRSIGTWDVTVNLFIIEAPGKVRGLSDALRRANVRSVEIIATRGHLCANPNGFDPLTIDIHFRETCYRLKPDREALAAQITFRASEVSHIYLATDDDQEGDVIARDAVRFCIPPEYRNKVKRLRLKALAHSELVTALRAAQPFDELAADPGDARRVLDRLIGSLSSEAGAVGRVQGSLLIALAARPPVVGTITHTLSTSDRRGDFVATVPVWAGQAVAAVQTHDLKAAVVSRSACQLAGVPWNHNQVLLHGSLETGRSIREVSAAMQQLYEQGRLTYPRARDTSITPESLQRLKLLARANGVGFRPDLFTAIRHADGAHAHEAPNPLVLDVCVNRDHTLLSLSEQVLAILSRRLLDHGIEGSLERPDPSDLPPEVRGLDWHRVVAKGTRLWGHRTPVAQFQAWTAEQSLLHFASEERLGRPSTIVNHLEKFLARRLVTDEFTLTDKGVKWCEQVVKHFGNHNLSASVEEYLDTHHESSALMVANMIELLGLEAVTARLEPPLHSETSYDRHEISAGRLS